MLCLTAGVDTLTEWLAGPQAKADLNMPDEKGRTPLHDAALQGHVKADDTCLDSPNPHSPFSHSSTHHVRINRLLVVGVRALHDREHLQPLG